jgi:hypothetical protein
VEGFREGEALVSKRAFVQAASWSYLGIITRALLDESSFRCGRVYERKEDTSDHQPSYTVEVSYVGLVDWCPSRQCQHLAIFVELMTPVEAREGQWATCLSADSFWRGFSRYRCLYLLCIPPGYFRALFYLAISLCASVGLVSRPLSVSVGLWLLLWLIVEARR